MEKRAILISLAVAVIAFYLSDVLFKGHENAKDYIYTEAAEFIRPFFAALSKPIISLSWFLPGMAAGFLCTKNPIKHGAISGAVFGTAISLLGIAIASSQTHNISTKLSQISHGAVFIVQSSFLFSVSAAFAYQINARRKVL
jgi:hypothetical protein